MLLNLKTKNIIYPKLKFKLFDETNEKIICPSNFLEELKDKLNILQQNDAQEAFIQYVDINPELQPVFKGKIKTKMKCLKCKDTRINKEEFITLTIFGNSLKESIENTFNNENLYLECDKCKKTTLTKKTVSLSHIPDVLVFHNILKTKMQLPLNICTNNKNYRLNGIVNHIGTSFSSGHYLYIDIQNKQILDDLKIHALKNIPDVNNYLIIYKSIKTNI